MSDSRYASPEAFKHALEQHLRTRAGAGLEFARRRQLLVFERFLARVVDVFGDAVVLKGGLALELRIARARTTKDIDLRLSGPSRDVLARLQAAARRELGDILTYEVVPDAEHSQIQNDGMRYEGFRFRAECKLAGRPFAQPFGVDVAFGDPILGEPETITASDTLAFAGIAPPVLRLYPIETHVAEKLHAYTLPRARPNSRVKDLPDLALLASARAFTADRLRRALAQTFEFRATHPLPATLPPPPTIWETPYAAIARDDRLAWTTLAEVADAARRFLDPVLSERANGAWSPDRWTWG